MFEACIIYFCRLTVLENFKAYTCSSKIRTQGKKLHAFDSSSDSDFDTQPFAKRKKGATMEGRLQKLEESILHENKELRELSVEKDKLVKNSKEQFHQLRQCFECLVCKSTTKFPAMVSPCCRIVLGCETCIEQWLVTSPQCPHCRVGMTIDECSKLPFIRNLEEALHDSSGTESSSSEPIQVD